MTNLALGLLDLPFTPAGVYDVRLKARWVVYVCDSGWWEYMAWIFIITEFANVKVERNKFLNVCLESTSM